MAPVSVNPSVNVTKVFPSGNARTPWLAAGVLAAVTLAVYANSLHGPLIFDDVNSITGNESIRRLADWRAVLSPPADSMVGGRPVANLSFALNYAWGGEAVTGYHAVNLLLHVVSTLLLFDGLRRIFGRVVAGREAPAGPEAWHTAFAAAALWAVHPVLTATVSYIS